MPKMKALAITGFKKIEVVEVDKPQITDDEVLTKTLYTSISPGSYLQRFTGTDSRLAEGEISYPFITGYLNVGEVVEVGKNVQGYNIGDKLNNLCFTRQTNYTLYNGSDAEYMAVNVNSYAPNVIKLQGNPRDSAFSVTGTVGTSVALEAMPSPKQSVLITGQGLIGLGITKAFQLRGCYPIVTTDIFERRLGLSKIYGATSVYNAAEHSTGDILKKYPSGFDIVVESSGNVKLLKDVIKLAKKRVILASLYEDETTINLGGRFHHNRMNISANKAYPGSNPLALYMVDCGCFEIKHLISDCVRPEDSQQMYEALLENPANHLGVLVEWTGKTKRPRRLWND